MLAPATFVVTMPSPTTKVGASFTAPTVMLALAVATLKAVAPPVTVVSAVAPGVPVDWSQALNVRPDATVPVQ